MSTEWNGYSFDLHSFRKKMKYVVIFNGDLDLNGAYGFKSKKALKEYLKDSHKEVQAVFSVTAIDV